MTCRGRATVSTDSRSTLARTRLLTCDENASGDVSATRDRIESDDARRDVGRLEARKTSNRGGIKTSPVHKSVDGQFRPTMEVIWVGLTVSSKGGFAPLDDSTQRLPDPQPSVKILEVHLCPLSRFSLPAHRSAPRPPVVADPLGVHPHQSPEDVFPVSVDHACQPFDGVQVDVRV